MAVTSPNLWLYLFGHFHCAWYFTWYSLEMQYLHLKTNTQLLTGALVCKHQVVVWNSVLSEHFEAICTGKDRLRWATFSAEYVGQLISYYYISGKLEHIYPEKQQDNNEKDNGSKHMEGVMQGEWLLDEIDIAYWMSLPNTPILWTASVTNCRILSQDICLGRRYHKCSLLGWVDEGTLYR